MGCQPTKCRNCGTNHAACQLVNGLCAACRSNVAKALKFFGIC
jgi:predicted Zn-ribbon and HTH transcriptional regulator